MRSSTILLLVKHAMPVVDPDAPAREWVLSDAGRRASKLLAGRLAAFSPDVILTSDLDTVERIDQPE